MDVFGITVLVDVSDSVTVMHVNECLPAQGLQMEIS